MPGVSRRPSVFAALMSLCFPETPSQEAPVEGAVGQRSAVERKLPPRVESCAAVGDSSGSKVHCRFRPSPGVVELVFVISFVSFVGLQPRSASLHKLRLPRLYVQRDFLAKLFALCALQLSMCLVTALVVHAAVKNQAPRLSQAVQQCSPHAVFAVLHSAGRLLRSLPRSHERSLLAPAALPSQCIYSTERATNCPMAACRSAAQQTASKHLVLSCCPFSLVPPEVPNVDDGDNRRIAKACYCNTS